MDRLPRPSALAVRCVGPEPLVAHLGAARARAPCRPARRRGGAGLCPRRTGGRRARGRQVRDPADGRHDGRVAHGRRAAASGARDGPGGRRRAERAVARHGQGRRPACAEETRQPSRPRLRRPRAGPPSLLASDARPFSTAMSTSPRDPHPQGHPARAVAAHHHVRGPPVPLARDALLRQPRGPHPDLRRRPGRHAPTARHQPRRRHPAGLPRSAAPARRRGRCAHERSSSVIRTAQLARLGPSKLARPATQRRQQYGRRRRAKRRQLAPAQPHGAVPAPPRPLCALASPRHHAPPPRLWTGRRPVRGRAAAARRQPRLHRAVRPALAARRPDHPHRHPVPFDFGPSRHAGRHQHVLRDPRLGRHGPARPRRRVARRHARRVLRRRRGGRRRCAAGQARALGLPAGGEGRDRVRPREDEGGEVKRERARAVRFGGQLAAAAVDRSARTGSRLSVFGERARARAR